MQGMLRRWESSGAITRGGKMNSKCVLQANFSSLEKCRGYLKTRLWRDFLNHVKVKSPNTGLCSARLRHGAAHRSLPCPPFLWKMYLFSGGQCCVYPFLCDNSVHCVETQLALAKLTKPGHLCIPSLVCVDWDETLLLSLSQSRDLEMQKKIPSIPPAQQKLPHGQAHAWPPVLYATRCLYVTPASDQD